MLLLQAPQSIKAYPGEGQDRGLWVVRDTLTLKQSAKKVSFTACHSGKL